MMKRYTPQDYPQVAGWFKMRGKNVPRETSLPKFGIVIVGNAAGFLVQTDTDTVYIDFLISNPAVAKEERKLSVLLVITNLIEEARASGFRTLMATTEISAVKKMAREFGLKLMGHQDLFAMEL